MEYVLKTQGLCKDYKNYKALRNLNMNVPKGSIYGFVGKNGAGKTTLIRLISGLQKPSTGTFSIFGISNENSDIVSARKRLGAVIENPAIYGDMTAYENIREQFFLLGCPKEEGIDELLNLVGLQNTGKKKAKHFSLGMRQRLGIAIALCGNPDLLVLDEPINGLDPQGIIEIRELIMKLNQERGITVLISSHILDELSRIATWYGFIDNGHLVMEMSAAELEEKCGKYARLSVTDQNALIRILDNWKLTYRVAMDDKIDVYGEIDIHKLVHALEGENAKLLSIAEVDESLESFYMNLIGGGKNE